MNFFNQLASLGTGLDVVMHIKEKNGKFTVSVMPGGSNTSKARALVLTATAQDLDEGFFNEVGICPETVKGIVSNSSEVKKDIEQASKPVAKKEPVPPVVKSSGKGKGDKKAKKAEKPSGKKKSAEAPPATPDIFSQEPADPDAGKSDEQIDKELSAEPAPENQDPE
jgi:PRTRC genetic system protein E